MFLGVIHTWGAGGCAFLLEKDACVICARVSFPLCLYVGFIFGGAHAGLAVTQKFG